MCGFFSLILHRRDGGQPPPSLVFNAVRSPLRGSVHQQVMCVVRLTTTPVAEASSTAASVTRQVSWTKTPNNASADAPKKASRTAVLTRGPARLPMLRTPRTLTFAGRVLPSHRLFSCLGSLDIYCSGSNNGFARSRLRKCNIRNWDDDAQWNRNIWTSGLRCIWCQQSRGGIAAQLTRCNLNRTSTKKLDAPAHLNAIGMNIESLKARSQATVVEQTEG